MLAPEERRLLVDAIRPDPGFELDHALITTYSLDLEALLSLPLALTFGAWSGEWEGGDGTGERLEPVALLEALRRHAANLTVLCQAGAIARPPVHGLLSFLEPVVHGVSADRGGVFHPKVWLLRYASGEAEVRYRLLVLSRNLTYDRSWDTMLCLAGVPGERPVRQARGPRSLGAFVTALAGLAEAGPKGLDARRRSALQRIAEESARLRFELPEGVESYRFWPLGFERGGVADVFAGRRARSLVVSPFIGGGFLEDLDLGPADVLVARPDELANLPARLRQQVGTVKVLDPAVRSEPNPDEDLEAPAAADGGLSGLHAKLFIAEAGWRARLWTGSANATGAAFSKNVEFVVELEGLKSAIGIDRCLGDEGLGPLLLDYAHDPAAAPDPEQRRMERALDEAARAIGATPLTLRATAAAGETWELRLEGEGRLPELPVGIEVALWPATLGEHRAVALGGTASARWEGLELIQLTGFLCLSLTARTFGLTREVAITVPLLGAPAERDSAVTRAILADPDRVRRYLLFLLGSDDDAGELEMLFGHEAEGGGVDGWLGLGAAPTLFEALVRTLHRDPDRLDRVERLLADLGEEASNLLPEDFASLFATVAATRKAVARR